MANDHIGQCITGRQQDTMLGFYYCQASKTIRQTGYRPQ